MSQSTSRVLFNTRASAVTPGSLPVSGTNFKVADLRCANFTNSTMTANTDFGNAYLQGAKFNGVPRAPPRQAKLCTWREGLQGRGALEKEEFRGIQKGSLKIAYERTAKAARINSIPTKRRALPLEKAKNTAGAHGKNGPAAA